jgi:type I restriction enzyme, S subunit
MKTIITYYKDLTRWDIKSYLLKLTSPYSIEELRNYIYDHSEKENIFEDPVKDFPILGVMSKEGVYFNGYVKGRNINQPYKKVKAGELAYNPYRVNIGSIGIVQSEYDNFYISPAYVVFGVKEGLVNEFLYLVLSSDWFNPYLRAATSGSVRQNLTFDLLSQLKVPTPPLKIQKEIVENWRNDKKKSQELNKKAVKKEIAIDDYVLSTLGVEKKEHKKKKGGFIAWFKDLERWGINFNSYDWTLYNLFESNKYKTEKLSHIAKINKIYQFSIEDLQKEVSFVPMESVSDIEGEINSPKIKKLNDIKNGFTRFVEGDIIFAKITPCMENGKCAVAENLVNSIGIGSTEFHVLSPDNNMIDTKYLWIFLRLKSFRKSAERFFTGSAGQQRVPANFLEEIKIPVPPLKIQKEIVDEVRRIRQEISQTRKQADEFLETANIKAREMLKT